MGMVNARGGFAKSMLCVTIPLITFKQNGGWCWFQDERVIVCDGQLILGTVAGTNAHGADAGDLEVTGYNLRTGQLTHAEIHGRFERDDHAAPAFLSLLDGRVLAAYGRHSGDRYMCWRITARPGDITAWEPEQKVDCGAGYTYSNLHRLSREQNRIYNFHRGVGFNPNYMISDDDGRAWRYGGRLLQWRVRGSSSRPYVRYASNGSDEIHFITTEDHPRDYDNSIYHGIIRSGNVYGSNGQLVSKLSTSTDTTLSPTNLTRVFAGGPDRVAWTTDLHLDREGRSYVAFSVQVDGAAHQTNFNAGGLDHRYYYGRWDGKAWQVHEMAHAGTRLYKPEVDYTGLVALDPHDPDIAFISTNADPANGQPLVSAADGKRHHEIFKGAARDGGRSWNWTAMTANSIADNLRPTIPIWPGDQRAVLWLRGSYRTYQDYTLDVVGFVERR